MTTVLYRGNFQPEVPEPDRWSTEHQVAKTMEALGVTVVRAQEIKQGAWSWTDIVKCADEIRPDLFLWTQTWNVDPEGGYDALEDLRRLGVPSASFHLDLYWGVHRQAQLLDHPFWRTDCCFTADGGHDKQFARNGIRHVWSPPAIYEPDAIIGDVREEYTWPAVFVGSFPYPHPEHAEARRDLIMGLKDRLRGRLRVFSGGVRGTTLADLYRSATVVVGDSCLAGKSPRYWSDRIPETLGRAGFLVHPYVEGVEEHYTDGEHLRLFEPGDLGQAAALVEYYVAHPDEARAIALAGREHVLAHHTYRHRILAVFDEMGIAVPKYLEVPA